MATMRDKLISYDFEPINPCLFDEEPDFDDVDYSLNALSDDNIGQSDVQLPIQFCFSE
jgi:hypothetical protein